MNLLTRISSAFCVSFVYSKWMRVRSHIPLDFIAVIHLVLLWSAEQRVLYVEKCCRVAKTPRPPLSWIFYGLLFIRAPKLAARCSWEMSRQHTANKSNKCWENSTLRFRHEIVTEFTLRRGYCVYFHLKLNVQWRSHTQTKTGWACETSFISIEICWFDILTWKLINTAVTLSLFPCARVCVAPELKIVQLESHSAWTNMRARKKRKKRNPMKCNLSNIVLPFQRFCLGNLYAGAGKKNTRRMHEACSTPSATELYICVLCAIINNLSNNYVNRCYDVLDCRP